MKIEVKKIDKPSIEIALDGKKFKLTEAEAEAKELCGNFMVHLGLVSNVG